MFNWLRRSNTPSSNGKDAPQNPDAELGSAAEKLWQSVYDARAAAFSVHFGVPPSDIQKVMHLMGIWPGGGLYHMAAPRIAPSAWVTSSFGLSNPDMPAALTSQETASEHDEQGRPTKTSLRLVRKQNVPDYPGRPGYGYEFMVLTEGEAEWPLWLLQWAVTSEIMQDVDFLGRVDQYQGMTVEDIYVGGEQMINILITRARAPLPSQATLPNGEMSLLVATTVTDDEMIWSKTHGRNALMDVLEKSGFGQYSRLDRPSVFYPQGVEYGRISSRSLAESLCAQGLLRKLHLLPKQFGGEDVAPNIVYVPREGYMRKLFADKQVNELVQQGLVQRYKAIPEYEGDSVIPKSVRIEASGGTTLSLTVEMY